VCRVCVCVLSTFRSDGYNDDDFVNSVEDVAWFEWCCVGDKWSCYKKMGGLDERMNDDDVDVKWSDHVMKN